MQKLNNFYDKEHYQFDKIIPLTNYILKNYY